MFPKGFHLYHNSWFSSDFWSDSTLSFSTKKQPKVLKTWAEGCNGRVLRKVDDPVLEVGNTNLSRKSRKSRTSQGFQKGDKTIRNPGPRTAATRKKKQLFFTQELQSVFPLIKLQSCYFWSPIFLPRMFSTEFFFLRLPLLCWKSASKRSTLLRTWRSQKLSLIDVNHQATWNRLKILVHSLIQEVEVFDGKSRTIYSKTLEHNTNTKKQRRLWSSFYIYKREK